MAFPIPLPPAGVTAACRNGSAASWRGGHPILVVLGALALGACSGESTSDAPPPSAGPDDALALEEIVRDLAATEEKLVMLAEALSADDYAWRPAEGVRSSGEVFMHVASVNYAFPLFVGVEAPEAAGMSLDDFFPSIAAFEGTADTKDEIVVTLRASFEHLRASVEGSAGELDRSFEVFGAPTSVRGFWWAHLGHVHEHLGQLIAYARSNGVAPPWS